MENYQTYALEVDPDQDDKTKEVNLCSFFPAAHALSSTLHMVS
jgi:hypothetical protein